MLKKITAVLLAVVVTAAGLTGLSVTSGAAPAQALSGSEFDPGNIVSDAVFFNGTAMDEGQIQSWLDSRIGACRNGNCLNVKRLDTASRPADAMCGAYAGAAGERVSRILAKVSRACGINPQVLLVTLQKEQSLVSGDIAKGPSDARLDRAMGYACPDNVGGVCDPSYAGVYNQLYRAAWQFKRYANPAGTSNFFTWFRPGTTAAVQYNPNAACGTKQVTIRNQATANLYYYTPYTPNAAALTALRGTGDACSAYGNRNFWVYFNDWFGSPTAGSAPQGALDVVSAGRESVRVAGWAFDRASAASIDVHVYVDGTGYPVRADRSRPDVGAAYPAKGPAHGFDAVLPARPGAREVCVHAIGLAGAGGTLLGCRTVQVTAASPVGALDGVTAAPGGVRVNGWALDPETAGPIPVHVYANGAGRVLRADQSRPDIGRAYPAAGPLHGFSATIPTAGGRQDVCTYAINQGAGDNTSLGCRAVTAVGSGQVGSLDGVTATSTGIDVDGWALDGDTAAAVPVHVYVDGQGRVLTAGQRRADIGRAYPAWGADHGFRASIAAAPGAHTVCAYAINVGAGTGNTTLGCRTVTVTGSVPVGNFEGAQGVTGGVRVTGWAVDAVARRAVAPAFTVDGAAGRAVQPSVLRPDVARSFPGTSGPIGFDAVLPAAPGSHRVCGTAPAASGSGRLDLGCRTVVVP